MEGFEMGTYDDRSQKKDGYLTPQEPLLQESNRDPIIQSDGSSSVYLKAPAVSSEHSPHKETLQQGSLRHLYAAASQKGWLTEILAFALALVAVTAIIITLALHNGSTLPNWPFQISINALISVFGVILKGTMMVPVAEAISQLKFVWFMKPHPLIHLSRFDLASRGPWGASKLILTLRGQHLAALGAAITVLAIASDPFIQQVIRYHPCSQIVTGLQASILRTNNYTIDGIHTGAGEASLDGPMQAALFEGAYNSFSAVTPTCLTGNCTFPHYRTVGMCSGCDDISDTINTTCSNVSVATSCTWRLPSELQLNVSEEDTAVMRMAPATYNSTVVALSEIITFTELLDYDRKELINVTNYETSEDFSKPPPPPSDVMAVQCYLVPCVRTYDMEVVQNQNNEVLLNTSHMIQQSDVDPSAIETTEQPLPMITAPYIGTPMPCLLNGVYYEASSFTERNETSTWAVMGLLPNNATAYLPSTCVFVYGSTIGLQTYLSTFLQGFYAEGFELSNADPAWLIQLYNNGNATLKTVNATWAAIADSVTTRVRKSGDPSNSVPAAGVVLQTNTCVSVQWPWLIFPAALLVLTLVFLLATMAQSTKHTDLDIWKGSPLPLLFHGMDPELSDKCQLVDQMDEMEEKASQTVVQIKHTQSGLHFVDAARR